MTVIVADGGYRVGLGHWMRCAALSEHLPNPVLYAPVDHPCLKSLPLEVRIGWREFPADDLAIVDTYHKRQVIVNNLAAKCKHICTIVDGSYTSFQVDSLVSPHVGTETLAYHIPGKVLAGAKYALIRPTLKRRLRTGPARRLLVCLGTGALVQMPELAYAVRSAIIGKSIELYIYGGVGKLPQFGFHHRCKPGYYAQMPEVMYGVDMAITPASMTMLELMCCGVPCLTYATNDHQRTLQQLAGLPVYNSVSDIIALLNDDKRRLALSQWELDTVDGKGCNRAAGMLNL